MHFMRCLFTVCICFLSLLLVTSSAQNQVGPQNQYQFKFLSIDDGLSNNRVVSVCQDSHGFIWFATNYGVNRYDGQKIVKYLHNPNDTNTLSSNMLRTIFKDSKGNLWFGSRYGLDLYNSTLDNFTRFTHKEIDWQLSDVESIVEDQDGNIWIAERKALICYNQKLSEIKMFNHEKENPLNLPNNRVYRLFIDRENNLWMSILREGIYRYNLIEKTIKIYKNDPIDESSLSSNRIESIYQDSQGNFWFGTYNNGLNLYDPENDCFIRINPDPENSYTNRVRSIFEDLKGDLFIGTRGGLYKYNPTSGFYLYADVKHNFSRLSQKSILCSFIDNTSTLWIGTFAGGVNYTNLKRKNFIHYNAEKEDKHFLNANNIYAITEDTDGNLWIGSDNGLNFLDRESFEFTYYFNDPTNPNSLSFNDVKALDWDNKGNLWIGTNNGGLNYLDMSTMKFTNYRHDPENPFSLSGDKIYGLLNDDENNLWIMTFIGQGEFILSIDILPNGSNKFIHLKEKSYFGFKMDPNGDIYIGGIEGFWHFNKKDSVFNFIKNEELIAKTNVITKDSQGKIWLGSGKGLVSYDMKNKLFAHYSEKNGYPIKEVFGIIEDNEYNLWVSTISGLIKISNIVKDTNNIHFTTYTQDDGLQSKQFNYNSYYKSESGELAFGGVNGFNTFFPEQIREDHQPAVIAITNLYIHSKVVSIGEEINGKVILDKSITETEEIVLGPKHKIFSLEFASLHHISPEEYAYRVKLIGLDSNWDYKRFGNNRVTYTNLSPGKYTLLISAANTDGYWNENPTSLRIIVKPPFWKTWIFLITSVLLLIFIIFGVYNLRVRSIRRQNEILEKKVQYRTKQVSEQNAMLQEKQDEILIQNEELHQHRNNLKHLVEERTKKLEQALIKSKESDALKSAFLANMSHEIRTPMNAIMGFANLLVDNDTTEDERLSYVQIIQSNSVSLLKIIDEIIDLSIIESDQLEIEKYPFELNALLDNIYSFYRLNTKGKDIEIRKQNDLERFNFKINSDYARINQILNCLMDNALKFTKNGFIELGAYKDSEHLYFYVKDSGKGIPPEYIEKIFQRFIKIEDNKSVWTEGLGLGLAISSNISKALGGKIKVESIIHKGSVFTFQIPVNIIMLNKSAGIPEPDLQPIKKLQEKTILVAEDIEANFLYLKKLLKKTEANILWAKDGKEAIQIVKENPKINLILMDIKMPNLDGYAAAKVIKENNPKQIIIAQTAYARPEEIKKFYDDNFDEYITKPINATNLMMILEKFL